MYCLAKCPNLGGRGWAINEAEGWNCPYVNRLLLVPDKNKAMPSSALYKLR